MIVFLLIFKCVSRLSIYYIYISVSDDKGFKSVGSSVGASQPSVAASGLTQSQKLKQVMVFVHPTNTKNAGATSLSTPVQHDSNQLKKVVKLNLNRVINLNAVSTAGPVIAATTTITTGVSTTTAVTTSTNPSDINSTTAYTLMNSPPIKRAKLELPFMATKHVVSSSYNTNMTSSSITTNSNSAVNVVLNNAVVSSPMIMKPGYSFVKKVGSLNSGENTVRVVLQADNKNRSVPSTISTATTLPFTVIPKSIYTSAAMSQPTNYGTNIVPVTKEAAVSVIKKIVPVSSGGNSMHVLVNSDCIYKSAGSNIPLSVNLSSSELSKSTISAPISGENVTNLPQSKIQQQARETSDTEYIVHDATALSPSPVVSKGNASVPVSPSTNPAGKNLTLSQLKIQQAIDDLKTSLQPNIEGNM